jgi:hypothetical protein
LHINKCVLNIFMITINIQNYGQYQIEQEKLQELMNWLSQNSGVRTQSNESITNPPTFRGKTLINE